MATINQFQQYSQGENVITNNVLLMLSLLYELNPRYYNEYIAGLIEDDVLYSAIPEFRQQHGNLGNGIIDGFIEMKASKIIIETKIQNLESPEKLIKYTDSFGKDETKILFHLSASTYDNNQITEIQARIKEKHGELNIHFQSITYSLLVEQLKALVHAYAHDGSLKRVWEHFEEYCRNTNLLEQKNILRAMACGQSHNLNIKHRFYFDWHDRGYSKFNYLGIYFWKAVRYIGKIENIIVADYDYDTKVLEIKWKQNEPTEEQKLRLIAAIIDADNEGWGISQNHRFFLLKDFCETDFEKTSPGGIFRVRYFNLEDYLGKDVPDNVPQLARALHEVTWE